MHRSKSLLQPPRSKPPKRGAVALQKKSGGGATALQRLTAVAVRLMGAIPWRMGFLHLSIFCFWLVLLSGFIHAGRWLDQPITRIEVSGTLQYIQHEDIKRQLEQVLQQSFFTVDLLTVQQELEARPWVDEVRLTRQWPGTLKVNISEQVPAAFWNETALVNAYGEVFQPDLLPAIQGLPHLHSPEGLAAEALSRFVAWQRQLGAIDLQIHSMRLEARGSWQIAFSGDWILKLGKEDIEARLQRFISLYGKRLYLEADNILQVDARYTQGVAVTWKEPVTPVQS